MESEIAELLSTEVGSEIVELLSTEDSGIGDGRVAIY